MSEFYVNIITIAIPLLVYAVVIVVLNAGHLGKLKSIYKDSNLLDIANSIKGNEQELCNDIKNLCDMCMRVLKENAELKEEIKKIREKIYSVKE